MQVITLRSGALHAEVLPAAAGGLGRLDWQRGGKTHALLRPYVHAPGAPMPTPSQLACFPLVPWSNRIEPQGFVFEGRAIAPAPNRPGEPCPIHGDGWQHPWSVQARSDSGVSLLLDRRDGSPFSYVARLRYTLLDTALNVTLEVTNTGRAPLPFGLGLHPWIERRDGVLLRARSGGTWTRGPLGLPLDAVAVPPEWDFATAQELPQGLVDHVFCGWDGEAGIAWPDTGVKLAVQADMAYYILYAPAGANFFCFEPVDHAINAHNLPGGAARNGLTSLAPGRTLARRVSFRAGEL
ncbi:MAG: Aldose 1-epimerase [Massilia sp.]|nr:Aldose 1-epimerase [Massilia sp.]MDB5790446.1 Aldose 1-epimerase [Massilia sp.]